MKWMLLLLKVAWAVCYLLFATPVGIVLWPIVGVAMIWWVCVPHHKLPHNRMRRQWLRLHLRLHPGHGHATVGALHFTSGRAAMHRKSKRARTDLSWRQRIADVHSHSVMLGRAHYRHAVRIPLELHTLILSPPRKGKTLALARWLMRYPGPAVSTSMKADVFGLTSGIRSRHVHWSFTRRFPFVKRTTTPRPVHTFNPQHIGDVPSSFAIDPVSGCQSMAVAMRRARTLAGATNVSKMGDSGSDGDFFKSKAADLLSSLLHAAALIGADFRLVARWALADATEAQQALADHGQKQAAHMLDELHNSPAERTAATFRMIMGQIFDFMKDPNLATCVLPKEGFGFDMESFVRSDGTLYLITEDESGQGLSPLAPLYALILDEIKHTATRIGQASKGGRLPQPLGFFLDEVAQCCPIPLKNWLASTGGIGLQFFCVFHGEAQLEECYGKKAAQIIMDTSDVKLFLPGITDHETLDKISKALGDVTFKEQGSKKGEPKFGNHPIMTPGMIRQLPNYFALVLRGNMSPVIVRTPRAIYAHEYLGAKFRHELTAEIHEAVSYSAYDQGKIKITLPEQRSQATATLGGQMVNKLADVADESDMRGETIEVDAFSSGPKPVNGQVNGQANGRVNGISQNGHKESK